ncbi:AMP-binding protein, partial [Streptomyces sp. NPDC054838]
MGEEQHEDGGVGRRRQRADAVPGQRRDGGRTGGEGPAGITQDATAGTPDGITAGATAVAAAIADAVDPRGDLRWGTIAGLVRDAAARYRDREAVADGRVRISYAQLGERVERAAAGCLAAGIEPGDRVAVWAPNSLDWIVSALGAVCAGAVLVPLNT